MSALSPHRLAKNVRSIRRSPPPFGTQEIPPPQANLAHPGLPISSNLFFAPMVSARSKTKHIQQPPTSNVDALPNALWNKHSLSDRKILKKRVRRICCSQNEQGASVAQPRRRPDDEAGNTVFGDLTADLASRLSISSRWNGMGSIAGVPRDPGTKFSARFDMSLPSE